MLLPLMLFPFATCEGFVHASFGMQLINRKTACKGKKIVGKFFMYILFVV
jgi:hypothetical protein